MDGRARAPYLIDEHADGHPLLQRMLDGSLCVHLGKRRGEVTRVCKGWDETGELGREKGRIVKEMVDES